MCLDLEKMPFNKVKKTKLQTICKPSLFLSLKKKQNLLCNPVCLLMHRKMSGRNQTIHGSDYF